MPTRPAKERFTRLQRHGRVLREIEDPINAVAPGLVETPMSMRAQQSPAIRTYMQTKQPLVKGLISADDVAAAVYFLLSDAARCITGEIIAVDGGWRVSD